jgi:hypothetical protein
MVVTRPSVRSTGLPRAVRAFPAASANMAAAVTAVACSVGYAGNCWTQPTSA